MESIPTFLTHVACPRPFNRSWAIRQPPRLEGPEQHDLVDTTCFKGTLVGDVVGPVHRQREILIHGWRFQAVLVPIPWKKVEYVDGLRYRLLGWFLFEAEHEQFENCKCSFSVPVPPDQVQSWIHNGWQVEFFLDTIIRTRPPFFSLRGSCRELRIMIRFRRPTSINDHGPSLLSVLNYPKIVMVFTDFLWPTATLCGQCHPFYSWRVWLHSQRNHFIRCTSCRKCYWAPTVNFCDLVQLSHQQMNYMEQFEEHSFLCGCVWCSQRRCEQVAWEPIDEHVVITRTLDDEIPTTELMLLNMRPNHNDTFLFKFMRYLSPKITFEQYILSSLYDGNYQHGASILCRNCEGTSKTSRTFAHNHAGFCNRCWRAFEHFARQTQVNTCQFILQSQQEGIISPPGIKMGQCSVCGSFAGYYLLRRLSLCTLCSGCPSITFSVKTVPQEEAISLKFFI